LFIPDPDLDFLPIPYPGVKNAPDPGSATLADKKIDVNSTVYQAAVVGMFAVGTADWAAAVDRKG
jgi:hypothetical protein